MNHKTLEERLRWIEIKCIFIGYPVDEHGYFTMKDFPSIDISLFTLALSNASIRDRDYAAVNIKNAVIESFSNTPKCNVKLRINNQHREIVVKWPGHEIELEVEDFNGLNI